MARIVVEIPDPLKDKLREYMAKEGYKTISEAVRSILRRALRFGGELNG